MSSQQASGAGPWKAVSAAALVVALLALVGLGAQRQRISDLDDRVDDVSHVEVGAGERPGNGNGNGKGEERRREQQERKEQRDAERDRPGGPPGEGSELQPYGPLGQGGPLGPGDLQVPERATPEQLERLLDRLEQAQERLDDVRSEVQRRLDEAADAPPPGQNGETAPPSS